jgi:flagellar biosynthesis/type III secretory pathway protein FliH
MFEQRVVLPRALVKVGLVHPGGTPPERLPATGVSGAPATAVRTEAIPAAAALQNMAAVAASAARARQEEEWRTIEAAFAAIDERIQEIEQRRKQSLTELRQAAVELAVSIASRFIHERISAGEFAVEKLVEHVLAKCELRHPVEIRLHPADLELLERRSQGKRIPWRNHESYKLVADGTLQRGDCRVEAGEFGVLSMIETQLSELRQHLLENLDDARIERRQTQGGNRSLRRYPDRRETA